MKKFIKLLIVSGLMLSVSPVFAATQIELSPANVNVNTQKSFTITVTLNPNGTNNYAEKVELLYPSDILEVTSFALANGWMALTQSGYDLIDNSKGILIKSAGLPSGLSGPTVFGTITFTAKKSGNGTIKVGENSLAFEASSQSPITGSPVNVLVGSVATSQVTSTQNTTSITTSNSVPVQKNVSSMDKDTVLSTSTESELSSTSDQLAQVVSSGFNYNWLWLIVIVIGGSMIYYFTKKRV